MARGLVGTAGAALVLAAAVVLPLAGCSVTVRTPASSSSPPSVPTTSAPAPGATAPTGTTSPTAAGVVTVHLQVVHQGKATLAVVPVMIEGKGPFPFILDTGASTSGINERLAKQLHLPDTGKRSTVSGVVSSSQVHLVKVDRWSVGSTQLQPTAIGALPFGSGQGQSSSSGSSSGGAIAGLLGSDQLSRFGSITLDYKNEVLRFTP